MASRGSSLHLGDCFDVMHELEDASVDALVTDPPYGISFMGKHWDRPTIDERVGKRDVSKLGVRLTGGADDSGRKLRPRTASAFATPAGIAGAYDFTPSGNRAFQEWTEAWAIEALRVLKPGAHAVVFGGTRTYHRMVSGLEDAGFEIRDQLAWMFGSGFPKSLNVAKAIDSGGRPEDVRRMQMGDEYEPSGRGRVNYDHGSGSVMNGAVDADWEPSESARPWIGWGTALKPAHEPIVLARKPLTRTVAANVLTHGTGALNVDECRIEASGRPRIIPGQDPSKRGAVYEGGGGLFGSKAEGTTDLGRWPANVVLDEQAAAALDEQSGHLESGNAGKEGHHRNQPPRENGGIYGGGKGLWKSPGPAGALYGDAGGASRFFYVAKVDNAERNAGLAAPSLFAQDAPPTNVHPTVKPIALMRWLLRLVTPSGGLVLDPFMGSGSTGCAAALEGFSFVGIEREQEYMDIAKARIAFWSARTLEAIA